jgi:hypothetical protein
MKGEKRVFGSDKVAPVRESVNCSEKPESHGKEEQRGVKKPNKGGKLTKKEREKLRRRWFKRHGLIGTPCKARLFIEDMVIDNDYCDNNIERAILYIMLHAASDWGRHKSYANAVEYINTTLRMRRKGIHSF